MLINSLVLLAGTGWCCARGPGVIFVVVVLLLRLRKKNCFSRIIPRVGCGCLRSFVNSVDIDLLSPCEWNPRISEFIQNPEVMFFSCCLKILWHIASLSTSHSSVVIIFFRSAPGEPKWHTWQFPAWHWHNEPVASNDKKFIFSRMRDIFASITQSLTIRRFEPHWDFFYELFTSSSAPKFAICENFYLFLLAADGWPLSSLN